MDLTGRVIYLNTFSKTIAPTLRISYMILPPALLAKWQEKMGFYSCPVPSFEQLTLTRFMDDGYYERHLRRMRKTYAQIRRAVILAWRGIFVSAGWAEPSCQQQDSCHVMQTH